MLFFNDLSFEMQLNDQALNEDEVNFAQSHIL